ncbi:MAG: nucleotide sugar dehydrogenase [Chloroflexi bacterium]|nr:nucleotide sugar dehydrogenase [Chloroflexota bacterium]
MLSDLARRIEDKSAVVSVIGLGYVGLPVACMFAQAGFQTWGVDIVAERIAMLNAGKNPIEGKEPGLAELIEDVVGRGLLKCTTDYSDLRDVDVVLVSVQTPIDESDHLPRYAHLRSALSALGAVLKSGALVVIESTLAPGTMHNVVIPTLEGATGGKAGETFYVGHCPERVMPGRLIHNLTYMDRVAGGWTPEVADVMRLFYRNIVRGEIDTTNLLMAELVKTTENAYRDVQIAFANEVALVCEALGGDVWTLRELVNKSPGRNMLYPGAGVGGHCIPKDSWLLIANARDEVTTHVIPAARTVNRSMPSHVVSLTESALSECGVALEGAVIAVLGYAYLANSDDTRDTPSQAFVELMQARGAEVRIHDPYVHEFKGDLPDVLTGADAAVILVSHDEYIAADWASLLGLLRTPVLIDARHVLPDDFLFPGARVRVLGKG